MISFRQHVVTIVAVFLALGLGVLAGTTVLNQGLVKQLKARTDQAEKDIRGLTAQLGPYTDFANAAGGLLVSGALSGSRVIVLTHDGVDAAARDQAVAYMGDAGADVITLDVTRKMAIEDPGSRKELAGVIRADPSSRRADLLLSAASALAERLGKGGGRLDRPPHQNPNADLLVKLLDKGYLALVGQRDIPVTDIIGIGGPGQVIVVVAGAEAKPPISMRGFMQPLVEDLVTNSNTLVAAAEAAAVTKFSLVQGLRDDSAIPRDSMITVDDLNDSLFGGVALVVALQDLIRTGQGGEYGLKGASGGLLPQPT